jgi:outer membrane protein assembly factor BamE (lipoprotein component of BamABCDE complex)
MKILTLTALLFLTAACSSDKASHSKINALEVTDKLVKGKTTQAQVIEDFGTPDIVEKTPEGDMWAYNRHANESQSVGAGAFHYASVFASTWSGMDVDGRQSSSSTKTASLVLYFNSNKTLRTYTFRTEKY